MDWDAIDDEMYKVAPEFKDPRFDSLRLVLNIVSSVNAEAKVEEVRTFAQAQRHVNNRSAFMRDKSNAILTTSRVLWDLRHWFDCSFGHSGNELRIWWMMLCKPTTMASIRPSTTTRASCTSFLSPKSR